jgi:hypothetical protein
VCGKVTLVILHGMGGIISPGGMISPDLLGMSSLRIKVWRFEVWGLAVRGLGVSVARFEGLGIGV